MQCKTCKTWFIIKFPTSNSYIYFYTKTLNFLKAGPYGCSFCKIQPWSKKSKNTFLFRVIPANHPIFHVVQNEIYFMLQKVLIFKQGHHPQTSKTYFDLSEEVHYCYTECSTSLSIKQGKRRKHKELPKLLFLETSLLHDERKSNVILYLPSMLQRNFEVLHTTPLWAIGTRMCFI